MPSVSVVIPVKDGARYLAELLDALIRENPDEILVIDSGSRDASLEIARSAGVRLLEIPPAEFGHGKTRNLGTAHTRGDVVCFLTQDATPLNGWLPAHVHALGLDPRVAATFGPHVPRADTSPMIARELTEFFAPFAPDGVPTVQRSLDEASWHPGYLSNVNAAYSRTALEEIGFRDVPYAEDQAFARDLFAAGWVKAYHPDAAVLHAHDYGWAQFMRRYFDEYRGLRETVDHVEAIGVRSTFRHVTRQVVADRKWMADNGVDGRRQTLWSIRSAAHHGGRKVFSALGSRADTLPDAVQAALSLERRGAPATVTEEIPPPAGPVTEHREPLRRREFFDVIARFDREGPARLLPAVPGLSARDQLHVAVVIPPFSVGSGGHNSIFQLCLGLEARGHSVSIWLDDPVGYMRDVWPAVVRDMVREHFAPLAAPVYKGFEQWFGADVAVATGWQTVHQTMMLPDCRARAYLVHDHEPEFYATSVESYWAAQTYRLGLFHVVASPWLRDIVEQKYGGRASLFNFGVDHGIYRLLPHIERRRDTVVFYARDVTPRRAVPLGLLALAELRRRRPGVRIVTFGGHPPETTFSFEHAGVVSQERLAALYNEATVGLVLSMTNYSLIPKEMLACGLPCVDLAGFCAETIFGQDGPVELAEFSADAIADAIERLLDDEPLWSARSDAGRAFVSEHTWDRAAGEVEAGLRQALIERERPARDGERRDPGSARRGQADTGQGTTLVRRAT
jgi:O-antigen biosynthesis protein